MRILVDTNVVLRMADEGHVMHDDTLAAIDWLDANGHECVIVPQVLYEYWVVATRPCENNGLGMTTANVDLAISRWIAVFRLLLDERGVFAHWRDLVSANDFRIQRAEVYRQIFDHLDDFQRESGR